MSTAIQALDEREARQHELANLRMVLRRAEGDLQFKHGCLDTAEREHAELAATIKGLQKVTRALAEIPESALARLRSGGSNEALLPTPRIPGASLAGLVASMLEDATRRADPFPELIEKLRAELPQVEADVATLRAKVEELAATV
jgi:hypothetical protein